MCIPAMVVKQVSGKPEKWPEKPEMAQSQQHRHYSTWNIMARPEGFLL